MWTSDDDDGERDEALETKLIKNVSLVFVKGRSAGN